MTAVESMRDWLLAVDVGSSRIKFAWFDSCARKNSGPLPSPIEMHAVQHRDRSTASWSEDVHSRLSKQPDLVRASCIFASVNYAVSQSLVAVLQRYFVEPCREVTSHHVDIAAAVENSRRIGVDRLLNAVAANRIRSTNRAAVIVDAGTAVNVDLVSARGKLEGGAIVPGLNMSFQALHSGTEKLPLLSSGGLNSQPFGVGKSTEEAMTAGVFWSVASGICRLVELQKENLLKEPDLFLTGGDADLLAPALAEQFPMLRTVTHLTLSGLCLSAGLAEA